MPWIRTRPLGDDDVTFEQRVRLWWTFWLFSTAVPISTVRSALNKLDWEIIELQDKLKAIMARRMALAEVCSADYEHAKKNNYDKFGVGEWVFLDDKSFKDKVKPYTERPKEDWRTFFSVGIIRQYKLENKSRHSDSNRAGPNMHRGHIPGEPGGSAAIILPEHQKFTVALREDNPDVGVFVASKANDEKKQGGQAGGDKKSQKSRIKQNNPYDEGTYGNLGAWERHIEDLWKSEYGH